MPRPTSRPNLFTLSLLRATPCHTRCSGSAPPTTHAQASFPRPNTPCLMPTPPRHAPSCLAQHSSFTNGQRTVA
ncbi:hypothetical protein E2C01_044420 [Portunus trituberculatus]|uniref:Uncharacterized protein n=1 Tax=Portunus trituberculatus TaxID=210409 RepID=A0A5B7FT30_PORTR|nr:hypothetical protein [Portunus trituberculatus]